MPPYSRGPDTARSARRAGALLAAAAALLLAASSCRLSPIAPDRVPTARPASRAGDVIAGSSDTQAPPVTGIHIERQGDLVQFTIDLATNAGSGLTLADPEPAPPADWTFRLLVDTDQNAATGGEDGAEFAFVPRAEPLLDVWSLQPMHWELVQTVSVAWSPSRVVFDVPASAVGDDDGLVNYALDVYDIRVTDEGRELVPVASYTGTNHPLPTERSQVPVIGGLRAEVRDATLILRGRLLSRDGLFESFYDPYHPGGWSLQLFLNTDRQPTGYWLGYDYVVRGGEWNAGDGTFVTRKITFDDRYPGGWGPSSGEATFSLEGGSFTLAVPLGAIGAGDGDLDFALETYATVASPGDLSG